MKHTRTARNTKNTSKGHSTKHIIIGLVYANWCGHCQALKPEWDMFKKNLKMDKKLANKCGIFEVEDADTMKDNKIKKINNKVNGGELQVNGFPTLFKIVGGNIEYYNGERSANSLLEWAKTSTQTGGKTRKNRKTRKN
jgi:thiol-disulfide isomerase/thioredoxin